MTQCRGCQRTSPHEGRSGASLDQQKPPGWGHVANVGNGLTLEFFCPDCSQKIGDAARALQALVKIEHFGFGSCLRLGAAEVQP